jgi:hypothetical protein
VAHARKTLALVISRVVMVVTAFLFIRLLLKLFEASLTAPFVGLLYRLTDPLVWPFHGIFRPSLFQLSPTMSVLIEWECVIAIVVYWLIARVAIALLR